MLDGIDVFFGVVGVIELALLIVLIILINSIKTGSIDKKK